MQTHSYKPFIHMFILSISHTYEFLYIQVLMEGQTMEGSLIRSFDQLYASFLKRCCFRRCLNECTVLQLVKVSGKLFHKKELE